MKLRQISSRWALWVFASALLLRAAMPWLASASAHAQGKAVIEVCTVYGVVLAPQTGQEPAREHGAAHGSEHCALAALAVLAVPELPVLGVAAALTLRAAPPRVNKPSAWVHDSCAAWVARLRRGPPSVA